ncbi:MAG: phosphomannomutase/phosphoglucomutase [Arachnia propionica]|nr:MAG: phosphomannomutase/phosphoglucomutase [Arachnia propionica]
MLHPSIFKANDIRGRVSGTTVDWDLAGARELGRAYVELLQLAGQEFVLGRDMRGLGRELSQAFISGARGAGASVIDIGLSATDQLWFASGWLGLPGVQFTASHNPSHDNGIKFCLRDAKPVPADFMVRLRDIASSAASGSPVPGGYRELDTLAAYAAKLNELVPVAGPGGLKIVVDAGNGMAGHTARSVLAGRGLEIIGLYLELDGTFPNHPPNPLIPENLVAAQQAVREHHADLALVFDGDADRCFLIDERGEVVDPSVITAMIALAELEQEPGATIVINSITSWAVAAAVGDRGKLVSAKVGHTYIKAAMAEQQAIFGGEHSAHYYFRDFWSADTGMLAALHVMELVRRSGATLSALAAEFDGFFRSGEINLQVADIAACQQRLAAEFADRAVADYVDGLTMTSRAQDWWFNVRASNTEPLLRLNVETTSQAQLVRLRDEILAAASTFALN